MSTAPEIRLANSIAVQFAYLPPDRAAQEVASHLLRFWDPRMRTQLVALADGGADDLHPAARAAVELLRPAPQPQG